MDNNFYKNAVKDSVKLESAITKKTYRDLLYNLSSNMFKYTGFTDDEAKFLEGLLITEGKALIVKEPALDRFVITSCVIEKVGRYGQVTHARATTYSANYMQTDSGVGSFYNLDNNDLFNPQSNVYNSLFGVEGIRSELSGDKEFDIIGKVYEVGKNAILIFNNTTRQSDYYIIESFSDKMADLENAYYVNIQANKTPIVLKGDTNSKLSLLNAFKEIATNKPFIFFTTSKKQNKDITDYMETLDMKSSFIAPSLRVELNQELVRCLNFLGIDGFSSTKQERLVAGEVTANSEFVSMNRNIKLREREIGLRALKDVLGFDVTVELFRTELDLDTLDTFQEYLGKDSVEEKESKEIEKIKLEKEKEE